MAERIGEGIQRKGSCLIHGFHFDRGLEQLGFWLFAPFCFFCCCCCSINPVTKTKTSQRLEFSDLLSVTHIDGHPILAATFD